MLSTLVHLGLGGRNLRLVRLVHFAFGKSPEAWLRHWVLEMEGVKVWKWAQDEETAGKNMIIAASTQISHPSAIDGMVQAPKEAREKCERAIEYIADLIAVQRKTTRAITSVDPCVVLELEDEDDRSFVASLKGMENGSKVRSVHPYVGPDDIERLVTMYDRRDGVMLMAEALSHKAQSGKYKELVRLFENAFEKKHKKVISFLTGFLDEKMNYSLEEVRGWLLLRNGMNHADKTSNPVVYSEADVVHLVARMEQAAYDVLFNKKNWGTKDTERRELWTPETYMADPNPAYVRGKGGCEADFVLTDAFNVYPRGGIMYSDEFPDTWWPCSKIAKGQSHRLNINISSGPG